MTPDASPLASPHRGASPVLATLPAYLVGFYRRPAGHNKPNLGFRVKSRKP